MTARIYTWLPVIMLMVLFGIMLMAKDTGCDYPR